jgi:hypothetical protein
MNLTFSPLSLGKIIAIIALVLSIVFLAIGKISLIVGGLFFLLAFAILLL